MVANKFRFPSGMTLIEAMIACNIMLIGVFGVFSYKYASNFDVMKTKSYISASRIVWLLAENWRGNGGSSTYDPVAQLSSMVTIYTNTTGPSVPTGYTKLGQYKVVENNVNYFVTMSWKNVSTGLNALNIIVAWPQRKTGTGTVYADARDTSQLTTYAAQY
jgi:Tfp pilus assembly protein PilV